MKLNQTLRGLQHVRRQLQGALNTAHRTRHTAALPERLMAVQQVITAALAEVARATSAEVNLATEPHPFALGLVRGRYRWCAQCGGAEDRTDLHPVDLAGTVAHV